MMKYAFLICLFSWAVTAQDYTSFLVGNATNIETQPNFGICLMGGATEDDNAMQWFLNRANGGDVVVIRTSGGDGYNNYFYSQLGVNLNSVETLVIHNQAGATHPYVLDKVAQAEAIWFAGGNQATYVNYFKDNSLMELINAHINEKQGVIGGTSAGMAIMGEFYFDAINGSVTSNTALNNPFHHSVSIGQGSFLEVPFLENTITDTHYDNPDRKGRHMVFLSRIVDETGERAFGIAAEEYVGICIDETGKASVYGEFPSFDDYAYFIQVNCLEDFTPEVMESATPLHWNLNNESVKAYQIAGTASGANFFTLSDWETAEGGEWQNWWIENGSLQTQASNAIDCEVLSVSGEKGISLQFYPNPVKDILHISLTAADAVEDIQIFDVRGKAIHLAFVKPGSNSLDVSNLANGIYFIKIKTSFGEVTKKLVKH